MLNRVAGLFRRRHPARSAEVDPEVSRQLLPRFPVFRDWSEQRVEKLLGRAGDILRAKSFRGADGFAPEDSDKAAIALLAALPILERDLDWYEQFHTFILYPDAFLADIEELDEDGLLHQGQDIRSGEAWPRGPVVLAMNEVWASGQGQGFNVVVHELAHQIDHRNGEANGFPPLADGMDQQVWTDALTDAWEHLRHQIDNGEPPDIDPYAAEAPAEFFAVISEVFFDDPAALLYSNYRLHAQLAALYGYSP